MNLSIFDEEFNRLYDIDNFESLIWTERYNAYGDFELYMSINQNNLEAILFINKKIINNKDCYIWLKENNSTMIIENLEIKTDIENGDHVTISGRGLESILDRRIIWEQTTIKGSIQDGIKKLINESIISPDIPERKIENFIFIDSPDETIKNTNISMQFTGNSLYESIQKICNTYGLGFDIELSENYIFLFKLINGEDRSYDQNENPYVIFSSKYENFFSSDYLESIKTLKTITLIAGEGEGESRSKVVLGTGSGMERRELFTDARDIQTENYNQTLEEDKQELTNYEDKLSDIKEQLANETKNYNDENLDYNEKTNEYNDSKNNYNTRETSFNKRINDYNIKINDYVNSLTSNQKDIYELRTSYIEDYEYYDSKVYESENKISDYNNKLNNEKNITYAHIIEYENGIEAETLTKKEYENFRNTADQNKSEQEKNLPNYETQLKKYEDMIKKYREIISNDQKSLLEKTETYNEATKEHNKKVNEYTQNINSYKEKENEYEQKIIEYKEKIAIDEEELEELYTNLLTDRGTEKLSECITIDSFTTNIENTKMFIYEKDFFKGDIVQVINKYGIETKSRVSETVISYDQNGYSIYPTFENL